MSDLKNGGLRLSSVLFLLKLRRKGLFIALPKNNKPNGSCHMKPILIYPKTLSGPQEKTSGCDVLSFLDK